MSEEKLTACKDCMRYGGSATQPHLGAPGDYISQQACYLPTGRQRFNPFEGKMVEVVDIVQTISINTGDGPCPHFKPHAEVDLTPASDGAS